MRSRLFSGYRYLKSSNDQLKFTTFFVYSVCVCDFLHCVRRTSHSICIRRDSTEVNVPLWVAQSPPLNPETVKAGWKRWRRIFEACGRVSKMQDIMDAEDQVFAPKNLVYRSVCLCMRLCHLQMRVSKKEAWRKHWTS